jgi:hypothetical protein
MPRVLPAVLIAAAAAFPAHAGDWGQLATISSTLGVNANRLCVGEGLRSDIGCPTYAPFIDPTTGYVGIGTVTPTAKLEVNGDISATNLRLSGNLYVSGSQTFDGVTFANGGVSATGIITATSFSGDGSRLTGLASGDRITSGTNSIYANTGMNSISFTTNGTERMAIDSSGNIGIKTSTPTRALDISGSLIVTQNNTASPYESARFIYNTNYRISLGNGITYTFTTESTPRIAMGSPGYGAVWAGLFLNGSAGNSIARAALGTPNSTLNDLVFAVGDSTNSNTLLERVRIKESGNVGVGTTAPSATLHVSGTARITSWTAIAANVTPTTELDVYGTISATNVLVNGAPITGTADRITSGTTNVIANNASGYVSFTSSGVTTGHYSPGGIFSAAGISISTNQASFTTVYASGRVGIGIANPSHPLDISTSTANTGLRLQNLGGAVNLAMTPSSASSWSLIQNTRGQFLIGNSESSGYGYIGFRAGGSASDQLRISHAGNVGIGTTSPGKTLDVSGTAQIVSRTLIGGTGTPSATFQVSGSLLLAGNDNIPCTASVLGLVRRNPTTGRLQACR